MHYLIHKDKYILHYFDADNRLYSLHHLASVDYITDIEYQKIILDAGKFVSYHQPLYMLNDFRLTVYSIQPELQAFIVAHFLPIFQRIGLRKVAHLSSEDFYARLSAEQIVADMQEVQEDAFQFRFFSQHSAALQWLLAE